MIEKSTLSATNNATSRSLGVIQAIRQVSGKVNKPETVYVAELYFNNRLEFPAVGDEKTLYIATDEKAVYCFNNTTLNYTCCGRDYENVTTIESYLEEEI